MCWPISKIRLLTAQFGSSKCPEFTFRVGRNGDEKLLDHKSMSQRVNESSSSSMDHRLMCRYNVRFYVEHNDIDSSSGSSDFELFFFFVFVFFLCFSFHSLFNFQFQEKERDNWRWCVCVRTYVYNTLKMKLIL